MIHHATRVTLHFLAGLVAGLAVLAAAGMWLLSRGPITLDAVAPYVAQILSRGDGLTVSIDHTLLSINGAGHIVVFARGVHLAREVNGATLTLGDLALEFDPVTALHGAIAPIRIIVNRPELRLDRNADGSFHFGVGDAAPDVAEDWGQKFIGDLVHPPDGKGPLGYLTELSVQGASLTIDDRAFGVEWHAADANARLIRSADRSSGNFRIALGQGEGEATLDGDFTFLPTDQWLVVRLAFKDLKPSLWAETSPALAAVAALDLPVSGELRAELDPALLTVRDAIADLSFGEGVLKQEFLAGGRISVAHGTLQAGYDAIGGRINLGLLSFDLAPGTVSAVGTIEGVGGGLLAGIRPGAIEAKLALGAQGIKVDDLPRLWPERADADTRDWVTQHIADGTVDKVAAQVDVALDLSPGAAMPAQIRAFDGTMKFSNLSVEYFRPLPPVRNVNGTGYFGRTEIGFAAAAGDLGNIKASAATARFYQLDTHDEQAKINVTAKGPLADALALLDTAPLFYAREIGIDPKRAAGDFTAQLNFAFPLLKHLLFKDVTYGADATLTDVRLAEVLFKRDLSNGALKLKLNPNAAQVDGTAALAGVPLTFAWTQNLQAKAAIRTHYSVKAVVDAAQRSALGFDFVADMLGGPVAVDASYDLTGADRARAAATLDLKDSTLDIKKLNWKKAAGVPAIARVALDLANDKVTAIREASLQGTGVDAKGSMSFDDQGMSAITLDHVLAGDNDFAGSLLRGADGGWRVTAAGKSLDISGLFDDFDRGGAADDKPPPLTIDVKLDRLVAGPKREARGVTALIVSDGPHWQRASVDAKLSDKTKASLRFGDAAGAGKFKLTTDDLGALLKLMGIYSDIEGGQLDLTGHTEDHAGQRVLVTTADGSDYRVVRAPTLARMLSLASFSGMNALLTGQGIPFSRLQGEVDFATGKITLANMRAYGGAIGINASGTVDRAAGQMNVSGTLVPAYTLNSIIGDIPLIGNLIVGGEGQGIFAANFRVFGPIDNPDVSVNALSTLAPGFLRNLFLFSPRGP